MATIFESSLAECKALCWILTELLMLLKSFVYPFRSRMLLFERLGCEFFKVLCFFGLISDLGV